MAKSGSACDDCGEPASVHYWQHTRPAFRIGRRTVPATPLTAEEADRIGFTMDLCARCANKGGVNPGVWTER